MDSIPPSWHIARLSLFGRPSRTALVGVSVALASILVVTVSCALSTALANVTARVQGLIGEADAVVVHEHGSEFDEAVIAQVRGWTGVVAAAGRLTGTIAVECVDPQTSDEARPQRTTLSCRGVDLDSDALFAQKRYRIGRAPLSENEIALDPVAQERLSAVPGMRLRIVQFGDPIELIVTGIYERPTLGALQRPTAVLSRSVLAEATDHPATIYSVSIVLAKGIATDEWVAQHANLVAPSLKLESTDLATSGLSHVAQEGRIALSLGTMLAFLCCALIIATAMTTALNEQQRAFAMARCIGASRGQLFGGQLLAGAAIGLAAGTAGVPFGIALTAGMVKFYSHLLPAGLSVSWFGIALSLGGSTGAGVLGALWPAWTASRVSVLRALAPQAIAPARSALWVALGIGVTCLLAQVALTQFADSQTRFWCYAFLGLPLIHIGWFILAVPALALLGGLLASPLELFFRIAPGLLRGSLTAHHWRMGLVSGALMVGVGILVSTWSNGSAILENMTQRVRFGDAFVMKSSGFSAAETDRLRSLPGVTAAAAVGYLPLKVIGGQVFGLDGITTNNIVCVGFDSTPFFELNRLEWIAGDPLRAASRLRDGNAILVAQEFQTARGIGIGSILQLGTDRDHHPFEVVGVVGAAGLDIATQFFGIRSMYMEHAAGCVFMDFDAVERHFGTREAFLVQLAIAEGATPADEEAIARTVDEVALGAIFASGRGIRTEILNIGAVMLTITTLVAVGALILASFAAGSVITAGVAVRSYEFGVLQAIGASRGLICRLVLAESMIIGVTAGCVGTLFGAHVAWMGTHVYRDLMGLILNLDFSWGVIVCGISAVCLTSFCATLPAVVRLVRRAPRELLTSARN